MSYPNFDLSFNQYQSFVEDTAKFKKPEDALTVCLLGIMGEAGEIAEKVKKNMTHTTPDGSPKYSNEDIAKEVGDVVWYLAALSIQLGYDFEDVVRMNMSKLNERKEAGTLVSGTGDNR